MANKPAICKMSAPPSMPGNREAKAVLKRTENIMTPMANNVPCQLCQMYVETLSAIKPWMMVPHRKATLAR